MANLQQFATWNQSPDDLEILDESHSRIGIRARPVRSKPLSRTPILRHDVIPVSKGEDARPPHGKRRRYRNAALRRLRSRWRCCVRALTPARIRRDPPAPGSRRMERRACALPTAAPCCAEHRMAEEPNDAAASRKTDVQQCDGRSEAGR